MCFHAAIRDYTLGLSPPTPTPTPQLFGTDDFPARLGGQFRRHCSHGIGQEPGPDRGREIIGAAPGATVELSGERRHAACWTTRPFPAGLVRFGTVSMSFMTPDGGK